MISVLTVTPGPNHDSLLNLLWLHKGPFIFSLFLLMKSSILGYGSHTPALLPQDRS